VYVYGSSHHDTFQVDQELRYYDLCTI
jgi:hypothetical protein